jgi:hypothetical protein
MMRDKSKLLVIIVQSIIIALLLIYLVFSLGDEGRDPSLQERISTLETINSVCLERNDSLADLLQEIRITGAVPPFLNPKQVENLMKKGLKNPVENIRDDLGRDPDLINLPAVHGGKMGFYFRDGIHILNEKWVMAYFEDGHIAGALLLKYEIEDDGNIRWEVLDETPY